MMKWAMAYVLVAMMAIGVIGGVTKRRDVVIYDLEYLVLGAFWPLTLGVFLAAYVVDGDVCK